MKFTFEDLGWYFAWDEDGKYPVDVNNPIPVPPDGTITLYLTSKPIQQSDGTWVQWYVVEGNGEKTYCGYYAFYYCRFFRATYDPFTVKKSFIVAGDKVDNKFNIEKMSGLAIEELFYAHYTDYDLLNKWTVTKNPITDYANDIENGIYIKFSNFKNKLGGSSITGDAWIEFSEIPPFIGGVCSEMCDLTKISAKIENLKYKKKQTISFRVKILKDNDSDVVLFENQMFKMYWNNEDYGIYIEISPPVGEIKTFKLNSSPINIGEIVQVTLIKDGNKYKSMLNGFYSEFVYNAVDYVEQYVKNDDSLTIQYLQTPVSYHNNSSSAIVSPPTFAPNKNRGSFIDVNYISELINYKDKDRILNPEVIDVKLEGDNSILRQGTITTLYKPQKIKISNITRPIYVSAILNPVRMTGVVKRVWYVENNEIKYRDEVYAV